MAVLSEVLGGEVGHFFEQCHSCTQDFYYCEPDSKCYSDAQNDNCDHPFKFQPQSCFQLILAKSTACDVVADPVIDKVYREHLMIEPRSSCTI